MKAMKKNGELAGKWITVAVAALTIGLVTGIKAYPHTSEALSPTLSAILQQAGRLQREGKYSQAVAFYQLLLDPRASLNIEMRAYVLSQIADDNIERGMYGEAESKSREAIEILRDAKKEHTAVFAIAERILADALYAEGHLAQARNTARQALFLGRRTLDPQSPDFAFVLTSFCQIEKELGKLGHAEDLCQGALHILEGDEATQKADLATAYQDVANIQALRGRLKQALATIDLAVAMWSQIPARGHPSIVYALSTQLIVYTKLKAFAQGEELIPRLLALRGSSLLDRDHPEWVTILNNIAIFYVAEKKYDDAEPLLRQAVDIAQRRLAPGHRITRNTLLNYSYVLGKLNRNDEATRVRAESNLVRADSSTDVP